MNISRMLIVHCRIVLCFSAHFFSGLTNSTSFLLSSNETLLKQEFEFSRQPRSLTELERWKATELRSFNIYSVPVILLSILSFAMWKHFLSLSITIRMLCQAVRRMTSSNLSSASQLLESFVLNAKEHYSETFWVYDIQGFLQVL